jgi:hypothetical protein
MYDCGPAVINNAVPRYRASAERVLDAVLPGWRDGITREWGWTDDEGTPVYGPIDKRLDAQEYADLAGGDMHSRLAWVGPWLPVEEGTQ